MQHHVVPITKPITEFPDYAGVANKLIKAAGPVAVNPTGTQRWSSGARSRGMAICNTKRAARRCARAARRCGDWSGCLGLTARQLG
mmetsp:Transcript_7829/g.14373  ORF Transcript_7829/g.14373 Transcript_7829/m.14373 type:complete len:86 (-) Transcript_7829:323-580(-)